MEAEKILKRVLSRGRQERGLSISDSNETLSLGHERKADNNLIVMTDLYQLGHSDWVIIAAYYSMYHSTLSLLSKLGIGSKDHTATVAVIEYFFGEHIPDTLIKRFYGLNKKREELESTRIGTRYINLLWNIKDKREKVQYGIETKSSEAEKIITDAREFVSCIKLVSKKVDNDMIKIIQSQLVEMHNSS